MLHGAVVRVGVTPQRAAVGRLRPVEPKLKDTFHRAAPAQGGI